ncbi:hypothetical protein C8J56DRAFT_1061906 [Mycena floridula]|nr:hypothetical protein C8J56DRAFT_1061906 [Mycena floridula]
MASGTQIIYQLQESVVYCVTLPPSVRINAGPISLFSSVSGRSRVYTILQIERQRPYEQRSNALGLPEVDLDGTNTLEASSSLLQAAKDGSVAAIEQLAVETANSEYHSHRLIAILLDHLSSTSILHMESAYSLIFACFQALSYNILTLKSDRIQRLIQNVWVNLHRWMEFILSTMLEEQSPLQVLADTHRPNSLRDALSGICIALLDDLEHAANAIPWPGCRNIATRLWLYSLRIGDVEAELGKAILNVIILQKGLGKELVDCLCNVGDSSEILLAELTRIPPRVGEGRHSFVAPIAAITLLMVHKYTSPGLQDLQWRLVASGSIPVIVQIMHKLLSPRSSPMASLRDSSKMLATSAMYINGCIGDFGASCALQAVENGILDILTSSLSHFTSEFSDPSYKKKRQNLCMNPSCPAPAILPTEAKRCSTCLRTTYCSSICQRLHWHSDHSRQCTVPDSRYSLKHSSFLDQEFATYQAQAACAAIMKDNYRQVQEALIREALGEYPMVLHIRPSSRTRKEIFRGIEFLDRPNEHETDQEAKRMLQNGRGIKKILVYFQILDNDGEYFTILRWMQ